MREKGPRKLEGEREREWVERGSFYGFDGSEVGEAMKGLGERTKGVLSTSLPPTRKHFYILSPPTLSLLRHGWLVGY
jgi:hypothetical protein